MWSYIPAYLRNKLRANEIIITLMMNYIGIFILEYLVYGPWKRQRRPAGAHGAEGILPFGPDIPDLQPERKSHPQRTEKNGNSLDQAILNSIP